jgi:hypothetical protein
MSIPQLQELESRVSLKCSLDTKATVDFLESLKGLHLLISSLTGMEEDELKIEMNKSGRINKEMELKTFGLANKSFYEKITITPLQEEVSQIHTSSQRYSPLAQKYSSYQQQEDEEKINPMQFNTFHNLSRDLTRGDNIYSPNKYVNFNSAHQVTSF